MLKPKPNHSVLTDFNSSELEYDRKKDFATIVDMIYICSIDDDEH